MKNIYTLLIAVSLIDSSTIIAQAGALDASFNQSGKTVTSFSTGYNSICFGLAMQADGKIVAVGTYEYDAFAIARYMPNGTLDPGFSSDGRDVYTGGYNTRALCTVIQPDGKILAGGASTGSLGTSDLTLLRYNTNGILDPSFDGDGVVMTDYGGTETIHSMQVQPDGKIIVGGEFTGFLKSYFLLARYNADGSIDNTFSGNGVLTASSSATSQDDDLVSIVLQPDGKIIAGGTARDLPGSSFFFLARYLADGTPDVTFNGTGQKVYSPSAPGIYTLGCIALQPDGKIVSAGVFTTDDYNYQLVVSRLNADGSPDTGFDGDGTASYTLNTHNTNSMYDYFRGIAILSNGKILLGGAQKFSHYYPYSADMMLVRLNANGSLDTGFGLNGRVVTPFGNLSDVAYAMVLQKDGKMVVGGYSQSDSTHYDFALARYLGDITVGILDHHASGDHVLIYPNPVQKSAVVSYEITNRQLISISLSDMSGKQVKTILDNELRMPGKQSQELLLPDDLKAGGYILTISTGSGSEKKIRLLKE